MEAKRFYLAAKEHKNAKKNGRTINFPLFPSFPNSIWERNCQRNSVAVFSCRTKGSAIKLPQQVRSQMEFGNEGKNPAASSRVFKVAAVGSTADRHPADGGYQLHAASGEELTRRD